MCKLARIVCLARTWVRVSRYLTRYLCGLSLCHWLWPVAHLACQYCTRSSDPLYIANTFSFHSSFHGFDAGSWGFVLNIYYLFYI